MYIYRNPSIAIQFLIQCLLFLLSHFIRPRRVGKAIWPAAKDDLKFFKENMSIKCWDLNS